MSNQKKFSRRIPAWRIPAYESESDEDSSLTPVYESDEVEDSSLASQSQSSGPSLKRKGRDIRFQSGKKARPVEAAPGTDELKTKLANANQTIGALQTTFWKSFPSPQLIYQIKVPAENGGYEYLHADNSGYLCSSKDADLKGHFKFEKDPDGTISIYSNSKAKYLQIQNSSGTSAAFVMFLANVENKSKFTLIFHPQQDKPHPGILVDIYSLENRCFLSVEGIQENRLVANRRLRSAEVIQQNRVVAKSPAAPANKFLILAEELA